MKPFALLCALSFAPLFSGCSTTESVKSASCPHCTKNVTPSPYSSKPWISPRSVEYLCSVCGTDCKKGCPQKCEECKGQMLACCTRPPAAERTVLAPRLTVTITAPRKLIGLRKALGTEMRMKGYRLRRSDPANAKALFLPRGHEFYAGTIGLSRPPAGLAGAENAQKCSIFRIDKRRESGPVLRGGEVHLVRLLHFLQTGAVEGMG